MNEIADRLELGRAGAVAEAIADLRKDCRDRLRGEACLACEDKDGGLQSKPGFHLRDWIEVLDGLNEIEEAAAKKRIVLTDNQKGIIRLQRKHGKRTPRQLLDGLDLLRNIVTTEVEALIAVGLERAEGNGQNKSIRLADAL